ncbi:TfoX/Sxy family protein [Noviherbaspirillum aerium]|uniref:TfoX/Sxy family protein n=1 Tax=Noviherbaspirillum aerium TaxID=2588497 RepID=UPI00124BD034|nr:TfoX/Sxy family protein [Noviherbaspirillum aerium]
MTITDLPNLGPKSQRVLERAGIKSYEQLLALGSVFAFVRVKRSGAEPGLNFLWALEGALTRLPWKVVAREHRASLLRALESHERDV